jgi:tRNA-Thr(GGU) m(6)t(6)A37 methyltransferase TsaA
MHSTMTMLVVAAVLAWAAWACGGCAQEEGPGTPREQAGEPEATSRAEAADKDRESEAETFFKVVPIGEVIRRDGRTLIVIKDKYRDGLKGLEGFKHVTVVYWFHGNDTPAKRSILQVHPRGNPANPIRGVFATHAPVRPNLIAISRCKLIGVDGCEIEIESIDAWDHSPVLDLKN